MLNTVVVSMPKLKTTLGAPLMSLLVLSSGKGRKLSVEPATSVEKNPDYSDVYMDQMMKLVIISVRKSWGSF